MAETAHDTRGVVLAPADGPLGPTLQPRIACRQLASTDRTLGPPTPAAAPTLLMPAREQRAMRKAAELGWWLERRPAEAALRLSEPHKVEVVPFVPTRPLLIAERG